MPDVVERVDMTAEPMPRASRGWNELTPLTPTVSKVTLGGGPTRVDAAAGPWAIERLVVDCGCGLHAIHALPVGQRGDLVLVAILVAVSRSG